MTDLITTQRPQLPVALPDLAKYIVFNRERLASIRAEIRAIERLDIAKDVLEQKHSEGRELANAILDAEIQVGRLTQTMEKSGGGRPEKTLDNVVRSFKEYPDNELPDNVVQKYPTNITPFPTKAKALADIGITPRQASRYETMAKHPDAVAEAKVNAAVENRMVTQKEVLDIVQARRERPQPPDAEADHSLCKRLDKALSAVNDLPDDAQSIQSILIALDASILEMGTEYDDLLVDDTLSSMSRAIAKLTRIYNTMKGARK